MSGLKEIRTAADADSIREAIESVYEGWYSEGAIDWSDFLDRVENYGYDLGDSMRSEAISRIKAIVRQMRRESE